MTKEELYGYFYARSLDFAHIQHNLSKFTLVFVPDEEEYKNYYADKSLQDFAYWSEMAAKETLE